MFPDFGYIEEGRLGKPYDLKLISRLASYIKPYRLLLGVSLALILLMTGLDLLIPYLTKEAIDRYIVVYAREVKLREDDPEEKKQFLQKYGSDLISSGKEGTFLLKSERLRSIDKKEIHLLQKKGILGENRFYVFSAKYPVQQEMIKKYPYLFERSGGYWFISLDRIGEMKKQDLLVLRRDDLEGVLKICFVLIAILVIHFALNFLQVYAIEAAGQGIMHDLRMHLFSHILSLPVPFFDKNPVGRLVTRLTNDVQNIHEMFTSVLVYLFKDVILLLGIVIVLLHLNKGLALVSFSVVPLIFLTTLSFSRRARDAFREVRLRIAQMNAFFQENFSGIKVVKMFLREEENGSRFSRINEGHFHANMKQISVMAFFVPLIEVLSSVATGLLLWYGGGRVIQERITLGALVAFLSYIRMFFQPIRDLSEKYTILQSAMASMERIFNLLDHREEVRPTDSPVKQQIKGRIDFREVSFSYNGKDRVLQGVSFSVDEGETVAIVGVTGAGKTSLMYLLERFHENWEGEILIDGIDIRRWDIKSLRSQIGLVMQDTFLFSGDIEENIRLGFDSSDTEKVMQVAKAVNADSFIQRLPAGYRTKVGEGGETISSGEMQLLAFARVLYADPKILILDEATSHVDPETELLLQDGLSRLLKGRTAIVIAHRLSTIRNADRIVVLHRGKVREIGTHKELMAKKGAYFRLYQLQFGKIRS